MIAELRREAPIALRVRGVGAGTDAVRSTLNAVFKPGGVRYPVLEPALEI